MGLKRKIRPLKDPLAQRAWDNIDPHTLDRARSRLVETNDMARLDIL